MDGQQKNQYNSVLQQIESDILNQQEDFLNNIEQLNMNCDALIKCLDLIQETIPSDVSTLQNVIEDFTDKIDDLTKAFVKIDQYSENVKVADEIVTLIEERENGSFKSLFKSKEKIKRQLVDKIQQIDDILRVQEPSTSSVKEIEQKVEEINIQESQGQSDIQQEAEDQNIQTKVSKPENKIVQDVTSPEQVINIPQTVSNYISTSKIQKSQLNASKMNKSSIKGIVFDDDD